MINSEITKNFNCGLSELYNIICDFAKYPEWRSDLSGVEIIGDSNFIEIDKSGIRTEFQVSKKDTNKILEFNMCNDNLTGYWVGKFEYNDNITKIVFIEKIEVKNLIMKIFAKKFLKKQQIRFMRDLENRVKNILS